MKNSSESGRKLQELAFAEQHVVGTGAGDLTRKLATPALLHAELVVLLPERAEGGDGDGGVEYSLHISFHEISTGVRVNTGTGVGETAIAIGGSHSYRLHS